MASDDELLQRCAIEALNAEFAHRIDRGNPEDVAELFVEDGSYGRASGERSHGHAELRAAYRQRSARGPRTARHLFSNLRLTPRADGDLDGSCVLTLFAADGVPPHVADPFLVADYDDIYRRCDDGRWRYVSRTITWLFLQRDGKVSPLPLGATR